MCRTSGSSKPGENPEQSSKTKMITGGTISAATGAATAASGVKSLKSEPATPYRTAGRPIDGKKTAARPALAKPAPPPTAAAAAAGTVHQQDLTRRVSTRSKKPGRAQVFFILSFIYCIAVILPLMPISCYFKLVEICAGTVRYQSLWPTKQCCGSESVRICFIMTDLNPHPGPADPDSDPTFVTYKSIKQI
jgi:hypothetical protein